MNRLKLNSIIIIGLYVLSVVIYTLTFDFWETDKHLIYVFGKSISQLIFAIALVWLLINGIKIIKSPKLEKRTKLKWTLINSIPIIIILIGTLFIL